MSLDFTKVGQLFSENPGTELLGGIGGNIGGQVAGTLGGGVAGAGVGALAGGASALAALLFRRPDLARTLMPLGMLGGGALGALGGNLYGGVRGTRLGAEWGSPD